MCRHLNGCPADNRLGNLVWGTHAENQEDKARHNLERPDGRLQGEAVHLSRLTEAQVLEILARQDESPVVVGAHYGVDESTIRAITEGRTWKHLGGSRSRVDRRLRGAANKTSKLTKEKVVEARRLHADGVTYTSLGERYGVSRVAIRNAIVGRTWRHVTEGL